MTIEGIRGIFGGYKGNVGGYLLYCLVGICCIVWWALKAGRHCELEEGSGAAC